MLRSTKCWSFLRVALALALVGGTTGADAQSTNTIYACVNNASGGLYLVGPTTGCKPNETLVTWNIVGPVGPQGPPGPAGLAITPANWVTQNCVLPPNSGTLECTASCPDGQLAISGGCSSSGLLFLEGTSVNQFRDGWSCRVANNNPEALVVEVAVLCTP
jgi:hypothetical protein